MSGSHLIFLGTYTRSGASRGIYAVRLENDSGRLSAPWLAAEATDPGWLEFSKIGRASCRERVLVTV